MDERILQFDYEWRQGDREVAKQVAAEFVRDHHDELAPELEKRTREDLVDLVTGYRNAGRHAERITVDMWLLAKYDPQRIWGSMHVGSQAVIEAVEAHLNSL